MSRSTLRRLSLSLLAWCLFNPVLNVYADPCQTDTVALSGNLDARVSTTVVPAAGASFAQLASYSSFEVSVTVSDSLLALHTLRIFFFKTAPNQFEALVTVDGSEIGGATPGSAVPLTLSTRPALPTLVFNSDGTLNGAASSEMFTGAPPTSAPLTGWAIGSTNASITFDFFNFTQFALATAVTDSLTCYVPPPPPTPTPTATSTPTPTPSPSPTPFGNGAMRDFDGDKADDLVLFDQARRTFRIVFSSSGAAFYRPFPMTRDSEYAFAGDFIGDDAPELVLYSPRRNRWNICTDPLVSGCFRPLIIGYGRRGDVPVAGDFDGDGKLDLALFRKQRRGIVFRKAFDPAETFVPGAIRKETIVGASAISVP